MTSPNKLTMPQLLPHLQLIKPCVIVNRIASDSHYKEPAVAEAVEVAQAGATLQRQCPVLHHEVLYGA